MKVVFKVGDNSGTGSQKANHRLAEKSSISPAVVPHPTTWRPVSSNDDRTGRRRFPSPLPPPPDGYQEDEAMGQEEDRRPGQHESLVKRLRERILLDAAVTEGGASSGGIWNHGTWGPLCTLVVSFLVQMCSPQRP